ncbi:hypothetical protein PFISCL1PPCAC_21636, partial [Pristionchus fissidentatus]
HRLTSTAEQVMERAMIEYDIAEVKQKEEYESLSTLPAEILSLIIGKLSLRDRTAVRLCRRLYTIEQEMIPLNQLEECPLHLHLKVLNEDKLVLKWYEQGRSYIDVLISNPYTTILTDFDCALLMMQRIAATTRLHSLLCTNTGLLSDANERRLYTALQRLSCRDIK